MPIYEYNCKRCGDFEISQRISEDPLKKCPTCGAKVTKLISPSAFHLKGSGWYMTDYGKSGASKSETGDSTKSTETKEGNGASASSTTTESASSAKASAGSSSVKESSTSA
jgi:putative FmdB family regulatory protein